MFINEMEEGALSEQHRHADWMISTPRLILHKEVKTRTDMYIYVLKPSVTAVPAQETKHVHLK